MRVQGMGLTSRWQRRLRLMAAAIAAGSVLLVAPAAFASIAFTQVYSGISQRPEAVAFGDLTGNGRLDAVLGVPGGIIPMYGHADGSFTAARRSACPVTRTPSRSAT
jgi:hypothetical protein